MVGRLDLRPCAGGSGAKYRWARKICKIQEFRQPFLGLFIGTYSTATHVEACAPVSTSSPQEPKSWPTTLTLTS